MNSRAQAARIRNAAGARYADMFTPAWYRNHPAAWHVAHPHADVWAAATWTALAGWVGMNAQPLVYGGGDSAVYINGDQEQGAQQEFASAEDPMQDTAAAAEDDQLHGADANVASEEWLPLGVFALAPNEEQAESHLILQLAINKQGVIGGSYYDAVADSSFPIQGSIDKAAQKAVWTIGPNQSTAMETDLKSLTEGRAPLRVLFGKDRAQDWVMVRLENVQ